MHRLSPKSLGDLPRNVAVPNYDRSRAGIGIVHLGIGAFHRAHQAVYTDEVLQSGLGNWAICGVSLRGPGVRDQMLPQKGLYTVAEKTGSGETYRVIGAVREVLFAPDDRTAVLDRMSDPATSIVSLTMTEKGYCRNPATGHLDLANPDIVHDIGNAGNPHSGPGFLVRALDLRRRAGHVPFTVLSCDNLPQNGRAIRTVVLALARQIDPELADWIGGNVAFPCTMVDRIVPTTTDVDRAAFAAATGLHDEALVVCEPFRQWAIEDCFCAGRPPWEQAGAMLVEDVEPYEAMKLRLLNGTHSALAYLGYLAGKEYISDCLADPDLAAYAEDLMRSEIAPELAPPDGFHIDDYIARLLERFSNPALRHRTWQIAMDGSQKLPQRLLSTVWSRINRNQPIEMLALALAAWIRYASGVDLQGRPIDVRDPLAEELRRAVGTDVGSPADRVAAATHLRTVFGPHWPKQSVMHKALINSLTCLEQEGVIAAVHRACSPRRHHAGN